MGWIFVNERNWIYLLPIFCVAGGFAGAAQALASFVILLDMTPRENRSVYIATFWAITGEFAALAPVLGGIVTDYLKTVPLTMVGLTGLKLNFVLSGFLRLLSLLLLKGVGKIELIKKEEC